MGDCRMSEPSSHKKNYLLDMFSAGQYNGVEQLLRIMEYKHFVKIFILTLKVDIFEKLFQQFLLIYF